MGPVSDWLRISMVASGMLGYRRSEAMLSRPESNRHFSGIDPADCALRACYTGTQPEKTRSERVCSFATPGASFTAILAVDRTRMNRLQVAEPEIFKCCDR